MNNIAIQGLISQSARILIGPITLLVISKELSVDEMFFYFSFFNLIALQQLAEAGVGFVLKQYISHDFSLNDNGEWSQSSREKIRSLFNFSIIWFLVVALFILIFIGLGGLIFYSDYTGDIDWKKPWLLIILLSSIFTVLTPIQVLVESIQRQVKLYKCRTVASVVSSFTLVSAIYFGWGLYSTSVLLFTNNVLLIVLLRRDLSYIYQMLVTVKSKDSVRVTFTNIWPLLSKISISWILGYFLWNSMTLISYKMSDIEFAGRFAFTLALARAGYIVASSIINSQITYFSNKISSGSVVEAVSKFKRHKMYSLGILFFGYLTFFVISFILPDFYIFEKVTKNETTFLIFLFFFSMLIITTEANFSRCFKKEPYFKFSILQNITIPLSYIFSIFISTEYGMFGPLIVNTCFVFWSAKIFQSEVLNHEFN